MRIWPTLLKPAIDEIPFAPYGRKSKGFDEGASVDTFWNGGKILSAGTHSSCVYAVMDAFCRAMRKGGKEWAITAEEMERIKQVCFIWELPRDFKGIGGALVELGIADWVENTADVQYGDLAQLWHVNESIATPIYGHCCIIEDIYSNNTKFHTWSSELNVDVPGHAHDYYNINRTVHDDHGNPYERTWFICRIKEEWLKKRDIAQG